MPQPPRPLAAQLPSQVPLPSSDPRQTCTGGLRPRDRSCRLPPLSHSWRQHCWSSRDWPRGTHASKPKSVLGGRRPRKARRLATPAQRGRPARRTGLAQCPPWRRIPMLTHAGAALQRRQARRAILDQWLCRPGSAFCLSGRNRRAGQPMESPCSPARSSEGNVPAHSAH